MWATRTRVFLAVVHGSLFAPSVVSSFTIAPSSFALIVRRGCGGTNPTTSRWRRMMATTPEQTTDVSLMRVSEIRQELKDLRIDYSDCFDKESLVLRLKDARGGKVKPAPEKGTTREPSSSSSSSSSSSKNEKHETSQSTQQETHIIDNDAMLAEVRAMSIRALREELASRRMRWAGLLEKEDLVQAVMKARQKAAIFSVSGLVLPGQVADLAGEELQREISSQDVSSPILVDVYATWCGPCKLMEGQLKGVAADLGDKLRVVKMDSDKHPETAGQLRVQGLPTLILFQNGNELDRIEGALMKDQLIQWVESNL